MNDIKVLDIIRTECKGKLRVRIKVDNKIKMMRCGQTVKGSIYVSKIAIYEDAKEKRYDAILTDSSINKDYPYSHLETKTAA